MNEPTLNQSWPSITRKVSKIKHFAKQIIPSERIYFAAMHALIFPFRSFGVLLKAPKEKCFTVVNSNLQIKARPLNSNLCEKKYEWHELIEKLLFINFIRFWLQKVPKFYVWEFQFCLVNCKSNHLEHNMHVIRSW